MGLFIYILNFVLLSTCLAVSIADKNTLGISGFICALLWMAATFIIDQFKNRK